ncbi:putative transcriptional regulator [Ancylobacter sp. 3268]|uniref:helix-turn-helix domain-containing protein n=1 Tax=Ancylobacter sp. 3268 TaxID=2817752 RepID=UPI00285FE429|nr:helix-turn-helix domain-containing protein [Ancylobacter sp. 3268]MDR6953819.1 putative transcriptional regulator [Ancylobacter sp. 3268]
MRMNQMLLIRKSVLDVSQAALAAIAGTSQATVSRWEKGDLHPDRSQMALIRAEALKRGLQWNDAWFFEAPEHMGEARSPQGGAS